MIEFSGSAGGRWLMGVSGIAICSLLLLVIFNTVPDMRARAREAECKQNLHSVQLAVERFSVDSAGNVYPLWLCGGSLPAVDEALFDRQLMGDEVLSSGYLLAYPQNPFCPAGSPGARQLAELQKLLGDPYTPRLDRAVQAPAWRFGADCSLMGCVSNEAIVDAREHNRDFLSYKGLQTPSSTRYPVDSELLNRDSGRWRQGQFRYQARCREPEIFSEQGHVSPRSARSDAAYYIADGYTLWGFGSARRSGK
jgi:hypothetical protein